MKIEIKSRWSGSILFSVEAGSLKIALEARTSKARTSKNRTSPKSIYCLEKLSKRLTHLDVLCKWIRCMFAKQLIAQRGGLSIWLGRLAMHCKRSLDGIWLPQLSGISPQMEFGDQLFMGPKKERCANSSKRPRKMRSH